MTVSETCLLCKEHAAAIAYASEAQQNQMLGLAAEALCGNAGFLIRENAADVDACTRGEQFRDRLLLNEARIAGIAEGLRQLVHLPCPVGEIIGRHTAENGLSIEQVRVPFGVVGIIYEARPNVLRAGGFDPEFIQLIEDRSHESAREFMRQKGVLDVLIPRGGANLIRTTLENAAVPVIETGTGNCHIYVEKTADAGMAKKILINAKTQRTSVCNACESLVIDRAALPMLNELASALTERGVVLVGDEEAQRACPAILPAKEEDYFTEYLSLKLSVRTVEGVEEAIAWINAHSTRHSEAIVTSDARAAERFLREVDSACVYVNASTRFTDGFEFGFGAEMGISTQKLHARGPMGLRELTTYKYLIRGNGQIRR